MKINSEDAEDSPFKNEKDLETYMRKLIKERITAHNPRIYALENKKAVDILICRDGDSPAIFFLEVKYYNKNHGRLGFGGSSGRGFQPEILNKKPFYFEKQMRWVLGSNSLAGSVIIAESKTIRDYIVGKSIGTKFNNIRPDVFKKEKVLNEDQLAKALTEWLNS
jgi:hypothetical protein